MQHTSRETSTEVKTVSVGTRTRFASTAHRVEHIAVHGFLCTPHRYVQGAPRLDHILVQSSPDAFRYVNQVVLTSSGTFDRALQGSDHNLQYADLGIR